MIKSQTFSTQGNDPEHSCAMAVQKPNIVSQKPERVAAADYAKQQQNQQPPPPPPLPASRADHVPCCRRPTLYASKPNLSCWYQPL